MKFIKAKRLLLPSFFDAVTGVATGNKGLKRVEVAVHFWLFILLKVNWLSFEKTYSLFCTYQIFEVHVFEGT